jgi:NAD(P)-dependent dehydrogenase (short-subunit alcohol dehydrogenase family)
VTQDVAVVTGAGSGLGRAVALSLSEAGFNVIAVGRREHALAETARDSARAMRVVAADVSRAAGRARIVASLAPDERVRFVVHAAGVHAIERLTSITESGWRQILKTNVDARLFVTLDLLAHMGHGARVLFVGSNSATRPRKSAIAYCVSQAASFMLHECLKLELAERGIAVTSALPSPVDTPMLDAQMRADPAFYPDALDYRRMRDTGQLIAPTTVARFYRWLLTEVPAPEYTARQWNVRDASHHAQWLCGENLYATR